MNQILGLGDENATYVTLSAREKKFHSFGVLKLKRSGTFCCGLK